MGRGILLPRFAGRAAIYLRLGLLSGRPLQPPGGKGEAGAGQRCEDGEAVGVDLHGKAGTQRPHQRAQPLSLIHI